MNKKLIALAVATAFAAPAAMAEVILYGKVHLDVTSTDDGTNNNIAVTNNSSRLGFKGSEDLGNGLKAIFKYEMTYSGVNDNDDGTDSGTSTGSARNSYIGLAGDFGTLLIGRHDTPTKSAFYAAGNDHLDSTVADLNDYGHQERRAPNSIAYISPNMFGFKAAVAIMPGEQSGANQLNDENGIADSYSLGLMYKGSGIKAGLGYESIANTAADSGDAPDEKLMHFGASYTISDITLGAQYSTMDDMDHVAEQEQTTWSVAAKYAFGNSAIAANYGNKEVENSASTAETDYTGVGFTHSLSKRTSVWVAYANEDSDTSDADHFGVGMVHNF